MMIHDRYRYTHKILVFFNINKKESRKKKINQSSFAHQCVRSNKFAYFFTTYTLSTNNKYQTTYTSKLYRYNNNNDF